MLAAKAATPGAPTEAELLAVSEEIADIMIEGIKQAPVVSNWYAQAAAEMVNASSAKNIAYPPIFKAGFVRRSILSMESASNIQAFQIAVAADPSREAAARLNEPLADFVISASEYGIDQPLVVQAASHARQFVAKAAATQTNGSLEPSSSSTSARAFVDDVFSRGRGPLWQPTANLGKAHFDHGGRLCTHELVLEKGAVRLQRRLFDCGFSR